MTGSRSEEGAGPGQTTDTGPPSQPRRGQQQQRAAVMRRLREEVLEQRSPAVLSSFISSLEEREWQLIQDRMEPVCQTRLALESRRIVRVVCELLVQLLALNLEPEDDSNRPSTLPGDHLHKYLEVTEEALVQSSQPSVRSMLRDVAKQLTQCLCVLTAESARSDVTSAAWKLLGLMGEALADVTDETAAKDVDAYLEPATEEMMSAIADSVSSCQERDRKSGRILQQLTAKMTERSSHAATVDVIEMQMCDGGDPSEPSARLSSQRDIHVQTYPLLVSSEVVSSDLVECRGSCLQLLKALLAKFLALFSSRSFSPMSGPHGSSLPTLESASSDMLDVVVDAVKELCQRKKSKVLLRRHKKTKISEQQVNASAAEMKIALRERLREFLSRHKDAVEELKKEEMEKTKTSVSTLLSNLRDKTEECENGQEKQRVQTVRTLLSQMQVCTGDRLEDLISPDKLSQLLASRPSSGPLSPLNINI